MTVNGCRLRGTGINRTETQAYAAFFSGGAIVSDFVIRSFVELSGLFMVYGAAFAALSAIILLLYRHAARRHAVLDLSATQRQLIRAEFLM